MVVLKQLLHAHWRTVMSKCLDVWVMQAFTEVEGQENQEVTFSIICISEIILPHG